MKLPKRMSEALCLLVVLGLAGCAQQPTPVDAALEAEITSLLQPVPELVVAQQYAQTLCLRELGWEVPVDLTVPPPLVTENLAGIVGLFPSTDIADQYGYSTSLIVPAASPMELFRSALSAADQERFDRAIFGDETATVQYAFPGGGVATTTTDGCFGRSVIEIFGSAKNYLQVSTVRSILSTQANLSPALPAGVDVYISCMGAAGYSTSGINETLEIAAAKFGNSRIIGSAPGPDERSLAHADAECQLQAEFLKDYNEEFLTNAGAWLVQNESWVIGTNDLKIDAMRNAKSVLEASTVGS